uniref:Uncharacterized protein n=1 Tax=Glossina pallidipes TaxID=7398 RepID=A0A1A9ZFM9_GLOPL
MLQKCFYWIFATVFVPTQFLPLLTLSLTNKGFGHGLICLRIVVRFATRVECLSTTTTTTTTTSTITLSLWLLKKQHMNTACMAVMQYGRITRYLGNKLRSFT